MALEPGPNPFVTPCFTYSRRKDPFPRSQARTTGCLLGKDIQPAFLNGSHFCVTEAVKQVQTKC